MYKWSQNLRMKLPPMFSDCSFLVELTFWRLTPNIKTKTDDFETSSLPDKIPVWGQQDFNVHNKKCSVKMIVFVTNEFVSRYFHWRQIEKESIYLLSFWGEAEKLNQHNFRRWTTRRGRRPWPSSRRFCPRSRCRVLPGSDTCRPEVLPPQMLFTYLHSDSWEREKIQYETVEPILTQNSKTWQS